MQVWSRQTSRLSGTVTGFRAQAVPGPNATPMTKQLIDRDGIDRGETDQGAGQAQPIAVTRHEGPGRRSERRQHLQRQFIVERLLAK